MNKYELFLQNASSLNHSTFLHKTLIIFNVLQWIYYEIATHKCCPENLHLRG